MRDLVIEWIHKGLEMETGEELYIPADSEANQKDLYLLFRKELNVFRNVNPAEAAKLRVTVNYKDRQFWVVIKKISTTPLTAFKKDTQGVVSRVSIEDARQLRVAQKKGEHHA